LLFSPLGSAVAFRDKSFLSTGGAGCLVTISDGGRILEEIFGEELVCLGRLVGRSSGVRDFDLKNN